MQHPHHNPFDWYPCDKNPANELDLIVSMQIPLEAREPQKSLQTPSQHAGDAAPTEQEKYTVQWNPSI